MKKPTYEKTPHLLLRAINASAPPSKEIPLILTLSYEHGPLPMFNLEQMRLLCINCACCCLCCKCHWY